MGEAIRGRRDDVFLVSKVLPGNACQDGDHQACDGSLSRLGTDHLDCYLLHWRGSHRLEETIEAFEELRGEGKILSWGVSNFDIPDLEQVLAIAGRGRLACNQVLYNLEERSIEHRVVPWCEAHGVAVTGYAPSDTAASPARRRPAARVLAELAAAHAATPRQVALAFLTRRNSLFTDSQVRRSDPHRRERRRRDAAVAARDRPYRQGLPARPAPPAADDLARFPPKWVRFGDEEARQPRSV